MDSIISISDAARDKLLELVDGKREDGYAVWVAIAGRGPQGFQYYLQLVKEGEAPGEAITQEFGDLRVLVHADSAKKLEGATIDFIPHAGGFTIDNPNPLYSWDDPLAQSVQDVITQHINPGVAQHGGFVALLDVKDGVAYIHLGGGCVGCGMADVTLKQGIEVMIKQAVPQIKAVIDSTDHASGTNPYYAPAKGGGYHQPAKGGQAPQSPLA
jgi:Fe/S biogenesis protein NfuA